MYAVLLVSPSHRLTVLPRYMPATVIAKHAHDPAPATKLPCRQYGSHAVHGRGAPHEQALKIHRKNTELDKVAKLLPQQRTRLSPTTGCNPPLQEPGLTEYDHISRNFGSNQRSRTVCLHPISHSHAPGISVNFHDPERPPTS